MSDYKQVFKTVLRTYDLAVSRSGQTVEDKQRMLDVLGIVTEYHRQLEQKLQERREKRKRLVEARAKQAAEFAAKQAKAAEESAAKAETSAKPDTALQPQAG